MFISLAKDIRESDAIFRENPDRLHESGSDQPVWAEEIMNNLQFLHSSSEELR
jgi:hypothetical protein